MLLHVLNVRKVGWNHCSLDLLAFIRYGTNLISVALIAAFEAHLFRGLQAYFVLVIVEHRLCLLPSPCCCHSRLLWERLVVFLLLLGSLEKQVLHADMGRSLRYRSLRYWLLKLLDWNLLNWCWSLLVVILLVNVVLLIVIVPLFCLLLQLLW